MYSVIDLLDAFTAPELAPGRRQELVHECNGLPDDDLPELKTEKFPLLLVVP